MSDDGRLRPMPRRQQGAEGGRPLRPVTEHGPADARRYDYAPTYILRGLKHLHLEFTPAA